MSSRNFAFIDAQNFYMGAKSLGWSIDVFRFPNVADIVALEIETWAVENTDYMPAWSNRPTKEGLA